MLGLGLNISAVRGGGGGGELDHLVWHGQSNANGSNSTTAVSANYSPALMFNRPYGIETYAFYQSSGPNTQAEAQTPSTRLSSHFTALMAAPPTMGLGANEMPGGVMAALLGSTGRTVLTTTPAEGSKRMTQLGPEDAINNALDTRGVSTKGWGGHYLTLLDDMTRAAALAASMGRRYRLAALTIAQGEREGDGKINEWDVTPDNSATMLAWPAKAQALIDGVRAHALTLRADHPTIPVFIVQPQAGAAWQCQMALALHLPASAQYVVGCVSDYDNATNSYEGWNGTTYTSRGCFSGGGVHLAPDGVRQMGGIVARALMDYRAGGSPSMVRPLSITRVSSTTVDLTVHVPVPPLVTDTTTFPKLNAWGLRTYNNNTYGSIANTLGVTNVVVTDDGTADNVGVLRITTAALTAGSGRLVARYTSNLDGATVTVASTAAGPTVRGKATLDVTFTGDHSARLAPLLAEGSFRLVKATGTGESTLIVDSFTVGGGNTTCRVESPSCLTGTALTTPTAGATYQPVLASQPRTNIRDSATALTQTQQSTLYGTRQGQAYLGYNWLAGFDMLIP